MNNKLSNTAGTGRTPYDLDKQEVGYYYSIDKRDDFVTPTDGWNINFGQDIAGPNGQVSYLRTRASANFFEELAEGWVLHLRGTLGIINDYKGGLIRYSDRFFRGGRDFRGFERGGVGPREVSYNISGEPTYGQSLGANRYFIGTAQVSCRWGYQKSPACALICL